MLDATYEVGLSGPGRLHDLFVTHEAMSPGEWKSGGEGLTVCFGFHPSPFGSALVMATERGLAGLAFADGGQERAALADMKSRWPRATYVEDSARTAAVARRIFDPRQWQREQPLRVVLIGTDWEVRVWETLLKIPWAGSSPIRTLPARSSAESRPRGGRRGRQKSGVVRRARAIASSAKPAMSPAITGALPANARCSAGRRVRRRRLTHDRLEVDNGFRSACR